MTTYRDESGPGDTTAWLYDPVTGLLVQKLYDDGKGPSYTYTPDGKLATRTWARGVATTYAYDGWGNLTNIVHSDGTLSISMAYDAMGRQIETSDAAGVTTFAYDAYASLTNETVAGQYAKTLDRHVDGYGRNVGYSLDGQKKQTIAYDPATGRIASMDGFAWQYLQGTDLKQSLSYPNGTVAEWEYEPQRDLLTLVSNDVFSAYTYENDAAGRRISKNTERYGYNVRGELIAATNTATAAHYAYTFDSIGNRIVADELGTNFAYSANALNQYTNIVAEAPFTPEFDDDGNQTLVKTSTGIWNVAYNAENRPVVWSNETAVVTMDFDRMGRRVWYASVSGTQTNAFAKFVYDGYLCVQKLDGTTGNIEQEYVWDPTETVATRPLTWRLPATNRTFFYFHDGNKNVSDVIDASDATLAAHYDYAPFGAVTVATGPFAAVNPYRFSSEYHDPALGCVYYNYRHYNPLDGRWMNRDPVSENIFEQGLLLAFLAKSKDLDFILKHRQASAKGVYHNDCAPYGFVISPIERFDALGLESTPVASGVYSCVRHYDANIWHAYLQVGQWTQGWAGIPYFETSTNALKNCCQMSRLSEGTLPDGTPCKCTTPDQLQTCVQDSKNWPTGSYRPFFGRNCGNWVKEVAKRCCMKACFKLPSPQYDYHILVYGPSFGWSWPDQ